MLKQSIFSAILLSCLVLPVYSADNNENLVIYSAMSPELATEAAQAALADCRSKGYQVAVAVVDRGGNLQVLIRDRYAGAHTPGTATGKAWTAVSFRTDTSELVQAIEAGSIPEGLRNVDGAILLGGGIKVEAAGSIVGGIGVSGAPGGAEDDGCAKAGLEAVSAKLEF